jgi:hypothetical protein
VEAGYDGRQIVGIDLHRRRSVVVRIAADSGQRLGMVRIDNEPMVLAAEIAKAGEQPDVVLEATYGWYWAADALADAGAGVHLAHPLGSKGFAYRRVKTDPLTELSDGSAGWSVRLSAGVARFPARGQGWGRAAGVGRAGGAAARVA